MGAIHAMAAMRLMCHYARIIESFIDSTAFLIFGRVHVLDLRPFCRHHAVLCSLPEWHNCRRDADDREADGFSTSAQHCCMYMLQHSARACEEKQAQVPAKAS